MKRIENISCIIMAFFIVSNGICNYLLGEFVSEGIAVVAALTFFFFKIRFGFQRKLVIPAFILIIYIAYNILLAIYLDEWPRLLFIYTYLFFLAILSIPLYHEKCSFDNYFLINVLVIFACISSCYALAQRFGVNTILPLESALRATGLSRSSLNLTGCLVVIFGMGIFCINDSFKKLCGLLIIFLGILAAGGRGGIISALILVVLAYLKKMNKIKYVLPFFLVSYLVIIFFQEWFVRAFSAFNFVDDPSNSDRTHSYLNFLNEFDFFGGGIGSTSPAANRFLTATGFESSGLNMIYELGVIFSILFVISFIIWLGALSNKSIKLALMFFFSLTPVILGQQLFGIPSAFCALMLSVYVLISFRG